jgi:NADPH-dependent 2,4-dienoyl-CoA reductase/sulfur reductase-like enzyme
MKTFVIIGAGAAGVSAIEGIRSQDPDSEIIQVFDERDGYYSRPGLAYYLTGEVSEDSLFPFQYSHFERFRVKQINTQAKRIYPLEHTIELADGSNLPYHKLLISTGAHAAPAKVPGTELEGVVKLDNIADARRIMKHARKRHTAVIVGGGITALELVEGFKARGMHVHYFLRGKRYWSNVLDEIESHIVEQRLVEEGVQIHYQTELAEIIGNRGKVKEALTTDGRRIKCDVVGIAIGIKPRKNLAEAAGLNTNRGISVNEYLQSNDPDIFAAGDVAEVYDPIVGKVILDSLWAPARKQGYLAGLNMTGKSVRYSKGMPFNVTRLAGLTTTIIGALGSREEDCDVVGIVRGDSEGWRYMPDALIAQSGFDVNRLRVLVGENRLLGALLMGDQTLSRAIHRLITEKVDITRIRDALLRPSRPITEIIADFWSQIADNQGNIVHATIQS